MDTIIFGSADIARAVVAALSAAVVLLASLLVGTILGRSAHRRGKEGRHGAAAMIEGGAGIVEQIVFGLLGSPFALVLGIAAIIEARALRARRGAGGTSYRAGFALGLFSLVSSIFSMALPLAVAAL